MHGLYQPLNTYTVLHSAILSLLVLLFWGDSKKSFNVKSRLNALITNSYFILCFPAALCWVAHFTNGGELVVNKNHLDLSPNWISVNCEENISQAFLPPFFNSTSVFPSLPLQHFPWLQNDSHITSGQKNPFYNIDIAFSPSFGHVRSAFVVQYVGICIKYTRVETKRASACASAFSALCVSALVKLFFPSSFHLSAVVCVCRCQGDVGPKQHTQWKLCSPH